MNSKLKQILDQLERYGTLNQEDIPTLIKEVNDLYWSAELAWKQLEQWELEWNSKHNTTKPASSAVLEWKHSAVNMPNNSGLIASTGTATMDVKHTLMLQQLTRGVVDTLRTNGTLLPSGKLG